MGKMGHLPQIIQDLGFILITAAVVTLLFRWLKQPVVLGYLIAGFLVGPHFPLMPNVIETTNLQAWAEIGVIFLLFHLGLEFSFHKLAQVGRKATITALIEVVCLFGGGYGLGRVLGWSVLDSLFLGGMLSISSTTIILRVFEEMNLKKRPFVSLVFGVLVIEDLVAILLLVLLSTVAATKNFEGLALVESTLKLGFFLVLWFVMGVSILPPLMRKFRKLFTDETILVISIGLCLMMVLIATTAGFSPALGAFVMGSLLAETVERKRIEHLLLPIRDLFAAVFFVSVGMLIDPPSLISHWPAILAITAFTIFAKILSTSAGALLAGQKLKHSVQAGMSLAQIGEFSFIIAGLGMTLGVTSDFLSPIAVSVAAITSFTTPYLIRASDPLASWLQRKLPARAADALEKYQWALQRSAAEGLFRKLFRLYAVKILLNSVLSFAISLACGRLLRPLIEKQIGMSPLAAAFVTGMIALTLSAPFLWAIFLGSPRGLNELDPEEKSRVAFLMPGLTTARFLWGFGLLILMLAQLASAQLVTLGLLLLFALGFPVFGKFAGPFYRRLEDRFLQETKLGSDLNAKDEGRNPPLAPWDAVLTEIQISPSSSLALKSLLESQIKEKFGVMVVQIQRGDRRILAPSRDERLAPYDHLTVLGTEKQLEDLRLALEDSAASLTSEVDEELGLESLSIQEDSPYLSRSIRDSGLREQTRGLVVGLERQGRRWLNPDSAETFQVGDLVWLVGERSRIKKLQVIPEKDPSP